MTGHDDVAIAPDPSQKYWREIAQGWRTREAETLWRRLNDCVIGGLLARWLNGRHFESSLKTDLFEESFSEGLCVALSEHSSQTVGIDLASLTAHSARIRHPQIESLVADVRILPFADNAFELIVSPSTLDHFDHLDQLQIALSELARILRPGGEMVLTLDNLDNPIIRLRNGLPSKIVLGLRLTPYVAGQTCGRRQLHQMLEQAGFEVLELTSVLHVPRLPAVVLARLLERTKPSTQQRLFRLAMRFEFLERTPLRFLTGYFLAARVRKPMTGASPQPNSRNPID